MKIKTCLRVIAVATLMCFVSSQTAQGFPAASITIMKDKETPSYLKMDIPSSLGSVDTLYDADGTSNKFILHIQDAHANYDAQMKIKQILEYVNKNYGFDTVFVEGASSKMDAKYISLFSTKEENIDYANKLAQKGILTGSELFLLENDKNIEALGIENASLYRTNYEALIEVFEAESNVNQFFQYFDAELGSASSRVFSSETQTLIAEWKRFEQKHRNFMPFVRELVKKAKKIINEDLESVFAQVAWPQITRLLVVQNLEKGLNRQKASEEKEKLLLWLKEKKMSKELISAVESFDEGVFSIGKTSLEISPRKVLEELYSEATKQGFKFSDYAEFSRFAGFLTLSVELNSKELYQEVEALFSRMLDASIENEKQKTLLALVKDAELLRKLTHLELNRNEWVKTTVSSERLEIPTLMKRLQESKAVAGLNAKSQINKKLGEKVIEISKSAVAFYDFANKRDDEFLKEINAQMQQKKVSKAVLITGGFHTDAMGSLFRENAVSYATVTPRLSEKSDEKIYHNVMLDSFSRSYLNPIIRAQAPAAIEAQGGKVQSLAATEAQDDKARSVERRIEQAELSTKRTALLKKFHEEFLEILKSLKPNNDYEYKNGEPHNLGVDIRDFYKKYRNEFASMGALLTRDRLLVAATILGDENLELIYFKNYETSPVYNGFGDFDRYDVSPLYLRYSDEALLSVRGPDASRRKLYKYDPKKSVQVWVHELDVGEFIVKYKDMAMDEWEIESERAEIETQVGMERASEREAIEQPQSLSSARSESREREKESINPYSSKEKFAEHFSKVVLPDFFTKYPYAQHAYVAYKTAFDNGDKVESEKQLKIINTAVDEYNSVSNLSDQYPLLSDFKTETLMPGEVSDVKSLDAYDSDLIKQVKRMILNGDEALEFFAAGAATRLGLGNMFFLSPKKFFQVFNLLMNPKPESELTEEEKVIYERLNELKEEDRESLREQAEKTTPILERMEKDPETFDLPLGARFLLNRRLTIEKLVAESLEEEMKDYLPLLKNDSSIYGEITKHILHRQKISIYVNEDVVDDVVRYLNKKGFFGFNRENIFITVQPTFYGFAPTADGVTQVTATKLVNGHGYPSMQKFNAGETFTIGENGEKNYLEVSLLEKLQSLGATVLSLARINDILYHEPQKYDVPTFIEKAKVLGGLDHLKDPDIGGAQAVLLVENPTNQKGGQFFSTPALSEKHLGILPDSIALKNTDVKEALAKIFKKLAGQPYNRMAQSLKMAALLSESKKEFSLPIYIRFREFEKNKALAFAAETVSGDATYYFPSGAVKFPGPINDFKEAKDFPPLLKAIEEQNTAFKFLNLSRSEHRLRKVLMYFLSTSVVSATMAMLVFALLTPDPYQVKLNEELIKEKLMYEESQARIKERELQEERENRESQEWDKVLEAQKKEWEKENKSYEEELNKIWKLISEGKIELPEAYIEPLHFPKGSRLILLDDKSGKVIEPNGTVTRISKIAVAKALRLKDGTLFIGDISEAPAELREDIISRSESRLPFEKNFYADFVKGVTEHFSPYELSVLHEQRLAFRTDTVLGVLAGIIMLVDRYQSDAAKRTADLLKVYLAEVQKDSFDWNRFVTNASNILQNNSILTPSSQLGWVVRELNFIPTDDWFASQALQLAANTGQNIDLVISSTLFDSDAISGIREKLAEMGKMRDSAGRVISGRINLHESRKDIASAMQDVAVHSPLAKSSFVSPVFYTESRDTQRKLVGSMDLWNGIIAFSINHTEEDKALASVRDFVAIKLSQTVKGGFVNKELFDSVLAELLKQLPNVVSFAGKNQVEIRNDGLRALALVMAQLATIAATSKSA